MGGFFVRNSQTPIFFAPISYTSIYRYSFQAFVQNEFASRNFSCAGDCKFPNATIVYNNININVKEIETQLCNLASCAYSTGEAVIKDVNSDSVPLWGNLLIMFGMIVFYRIIIYLILRYFKWGKK
jgi:ATP-binding cassette subfamily G (WHITE) protein 2